MSLGYVDTSSLLAVAFSEPRWDDEAARLGRYDRLVSSNLLEAEFRAALAREQVDDDRLLGLLTWIHPDRSLEPELRQVLGQGYVRGADLWHLACALYLQRSAGPVAFLTADRRQGELAAVLDLAPAADSPLG